MLGELTRVEMESLLNTQYTARLGCYAEGQIYVVPIGYAYDGTSLISHTGEGLKLRMMRQHPEVCVEIDSVKNLANWQSVIAWGRFQELQGVDATAAARALLDRFGPFMTSKTGHPWREMPDREFDRPDVVLFRIILHRKTGRFERYGP
jgi:nitroimidazol reductase NimA-like FMN-containing flavoprotein (pyridoxamine 5'-phosphate oxidase superfamily)